MPFKLYKHQQAFVDTEPKRHLLAWSVGTGKTYPPLALAEKLKTEVLVICPKMLKEKWRRDLSVVGYGGIVVTKEEFKRDFKKLRRFNAVIVDEAHNTFGSIKTQGHKALLAYIKVHNPQYVWLLTGTPYTSTPFSIFALARLLGYKWDWYDFRNKYFRERYLGQRVIFEPKENIEPQIAELVRSIGSVVRLDECIDVPEQTFEEEKFPFTKEQLAALKALGERESNPLVRFGKAHQIANGILIGDGYSPDQTFTCLKNDRVVELAGQNEKMVVFSRYNLHLEHLANMLADAGIPHYVINGSTPDRDKTITLLNSMKRVVALIQADCAEGYELPTFSFVVHACHTYSFVKYEQSCGRVLRINAPKPNYYLTLTTQGSNDEPVFDAVQKKQDFHEAIFIEQNPEV